MNLIKVGASSRFFQVSVVNLDDSGVGRAWLLIVPVPGFGCSVWLLAGCPLSLALKLTGQIVAALKGKA
jgi:hypothetical protein